MPPKIDRNILIGELVLNYPASVEVLFSHGFHCIGCGLSTYETLEQGASAHGFEDSETDAIIEEIKKAVAEANARGAERQCRTGAARKAAAGPKAKPEPK